MSGDLDALRQRIEAELVRRDWPVRKASLKAGLGASTLKNFLNRGGGLERETAERIAAVFDWPLDEILVLAGHLPQREIRLSGDPMVQLRATLAVGGLWADEVQTALLVLADATRRVMSQPSR